MKVILYVATSLDGYIATTDGDSSWVSPSEAAQFENKAAEVGCIAVGRKTFEQYQGEIYPMKDTLNIVISKEQRTPDDSSVVFVTSPREAIEAAKSKGKDTLLVAGGATLNQAFLEEDLLDELFLDVEPIVLGGGMPVFGMSKKKIDLALLGSRNFSANELQLHYKVVR